MSLLGLAAEGDQAALSLATAGENGPAVKEIVVVVGSSSGVGDRYFSHESCEKPSDLADYQADLNTMKSIANEQIGFHKAYHTFPRPSGR